MQKAIDQRIFHSTKIHFPLIVLRHGQALYTKEEDTGGDIVEGTLSDEGRITVQQSTKEIIDQLQSLAINQLNIYASPKKRCLETSEIIQQELEKHSIHLSFQIEPELRDVKVIGPQNNQANSYTRWEEDMLPGENWYGAWMRKANEGMEFFPGEESPDDVKERVEKFIQSIIPLKEPTILVCHEEILGAIAEIFGFAWNRPTYGEVWYMYPEK